MSNLASSRTDVYASDVITHPVQGKNGTMMLVKYAKGSGGTSAVIALSMIASRLNATDEYKPIFLASDAITPTAQTFAFAADGNFIVPIAFPACVDVLKATVAFTGGSAQTMVVDFRDE
jgi:hypothetical protein